MQWLSQTTYRRVAVVTHWGFVVRLMQRCDSPANADIHNAAWIKTLWRRRVHTEPSKAGTACKSKKMSPQSCRFEAWLSPHDSEVDHDVLRELTEFLEACRQDSHLSAHAHAISDAIQAPVIDWALSDQDIDTSSLTSALEDLPDKLTCNEANIVTSLHSADSTVNKHIRLQSTSARNTLADLYSLFPQHIRPPLLPSLHCPLYSQSRFSHQHSDSIVERLTEIKSQFKYMSTHIEEASTLLASMQFSLQTRVTAM
jgi:hypothetical protein